MKVQSAAECNVNSHCWKGLSRVKVDHKMGVDKSLPAYPLVTEPLESVNLFKLDDETIMKLLGDPLPYLPELASKPIKPPSLKTSTVGSRAKKPSGSTAPKPPGHQIEETPRQSLKKDAHGQIIASKFNDQGFSGGSHLKLDDSMHEEEHFCRVSPRWSSHSPSQPSSKRGRKHTRSHNKRRRSRSASWSASRPGAATAQL